MTEHLLNHVQIAALKGFKRLYVGFSGGLDSTALLHFLASQCELKPLLHAIHINHQLSPKAEHWQRHCEDYCQQLDVPLSTQRVQVADNNIENAARECRYHVFRTKLSQNDCLLLAHHMDDQVETLLLQLFRGAGIDGLSGMRETKPFYQASLCRPLLNTPRQALADYANFQGLRWIDDESNLDRRFSRNYLRHEIIPLLLSRWPGLKQTLYRTTQHCQETQRHLEALAILDHSSLFATSAQLSITPLLQLNAERAINVIQTWLRSHHILRPSSVNLKRVYTELIHAKSDANPHLNLKEGTIRRYKGQLYFVAQPPYFLRDYYDWQTFPCSLALEGAGVIHVSQCNGGLVVPDNAQLSIRFRQGGEVFQWRKQCKQLKKLFQEWHIPPWLRENVPLLYINDELASVVGYAISDCFFAKEGLGYQLSFAKAY